MAASQARALRTLLSTRTATLPRTAIASPAFRRFLSSDTRSKIDKAVKHDPLVIFMKGTPQIPQCGFSRAVIQIMEVQGVPPEKMQTYNCLEDQELREGIKEYSDWPTIPQVYINGEFVGGCDIILGMHQAGELTQELQAKGIIPKDEQKAPLDSGAS